MICYTIQAKARLKALFLKLVDILEIFLRPICRRALKSPSLDFSRSIPADKHLTVMELDTRIRLWSSNPPSLEYTIRFYPSYIQELIEERCAKMCTAENLSTAGKFCI